MRATARFFVRFGPSSFGERVLETYAPVEVDEAAGATRRPQPMFVLEIVDREARCVRRRVRRGADVISTVHETIADDLRRLDPVAFEQRWCGVRPS